MFEGALFGAGHIALRGHAEAIRLDPILKDGLRITSCCDPSPASLETVRTIWPEARLYDSASALLASESPDFVDICTPPDSHARLIAEALRRGLHVFCEKPLCRSLDEAEELDALIRERPVAFLPAHEYHHAPVWRGVVEAVRGGAIGELRLVEWTVWRTEANPGSSNWNAAWRTEPEVAGGGILMDHGAHVVYQLRSLLGDPLRVTARMQSLRSHPYRVEDTASVILEYPRAVARLGFTWAGTGREITCRLSGTKGDLKVEEDRVIVTRGEETRELPAPAGMSVGSSHAEWFVPLLREFLSRLTRRDCSRDAWDEALASLRVLDACYRSAAEGRTVALAGGSPVPA